MENEIKGLVFDVQGYSVHDGPGCRTLVFMKGCPLHCEWCSNPEGMRTNQDIMFRNAKCVNRKNGCTRCVDTCPHHAIFQNQEEGDDVQQLIIDRSKCIQCEGHECLSVCFFEGLKYCGEWRTVDDIMNVFERNRHYWGTRGGASFSGGEPLLQHEFMIFAADCLPRSKNSHGCGDDRAYPLRQIFEADEHGRFRIYRSEAYGFAAPPRKDGRT